MDYFFGDVHFSAMNPWNRDVADVFIRWFEKEFGDSHKEDSLWMLGDLADSAVNGGFVIEKMFHFVSYAASRFSKVYILMGNHDVKLIRSISQSAVSFLNEIDNVEVIDKPREITSLSGLKVLCLPHMRLSNGKSIADYYNSSDYSQWMSSQRADVCIGHVAIKDDFIFKDELDIDRIPADIKIFGHIHTRSRKEYIGSVWPCKDSEVETKHPRCYMVIDKDKNIKEVKLPVFLTYKTVEYPEEAKAEEGVVTVFIVDGLQSLAEARSFYKDVYVKSVSKKLQTSKESSNLKQEVDLKVFRSSKEALDSAIAEQKISVSRPVYSELVKALEGVANA